MGVIYSVLLKLKHYGVPLSILAKKYFSISVSGAFDLENNKSDRSLRTEPMLLTFLHNRIEYFSAALLPDKITLK